ncbi:MAG: hypothetical protein ABII82_20990 [Verrucomicrobiota bacterium]
MSRMQVVGLFAVCTVVFWGCRRPYQDALKSNSDVVRLRWCLHSYFIGPGAEPIDTKENKAEMLRLLKRMEPLDSSEKINLVLDIALSYDATDNEAAPCAREMLIRHGRIATPFVRARMAIDPNPDEVRLLLEQTGKHPTSSSSRRGGPRRLRAPFGKRR